MTTSTSDRLFALVALTMMVACTNMLPPDARIRLNASKTTFELCDALAIANLAPTEVRAEWKLELDRRGENCGTYAQERIERDARDSAALRKMLSNAGRSATAAQRDDEPDSQGSSSGIRKVGTFCRKTGEALRGMSRHCIYDCLGSEVVQTVSSVDICPLSLSR